MIDMIVAVIIITPIHIKNNNIGKQRNDQLNKPINKGIYNASDKNVVIKHRINCVFSLQMVLLLWDFYLPMFYLYEDQKL